MRSNRGVNHERSTEATVMYCSSIVNLTKSEVGQKHQRSGASQYYRHIASQPTTGDIVVSVAAACVSQCNSGASRLAHHTCTAPEPRRSFRRRQLASRTRRDTSETWGIMRSRKCGGRVTAPKTPSNGALAPGRLNCRCSVVGVMSKVMSNGGVWVDPEADVCF